MGDAYESLLVGNDDNELVIVITATKIHKFEGTKHYTTVITTVNVYHWHILTK